ncbi:MAG TPA: hypothetical protein VGB42_06570 [Candidatus Thermoplasmatota archaeon]
MRPALLAATAMWVVAVASALASAGEVGAADPYELRLDRYPHPGGCGEFEVVGILVANGTGSPARGVYIDVWDEEFPNETRNGTITSYEGDFRVQGELGTHGGPAIIHLLAADPNPPFGRQDFTFDVDVPFDGCGAPGPGAGEALGALALASVVAAQIWRRRQTDP